MHAVYSRAVLNVEASNAKDCASSCFVSREAGYRHGARMSLQLPNNNDDDNNNKIHLIPEPDLIAASIISGPLAERGRVLQEQLPARRVLCFGDQMFWECSET